MLVLSMVFTSCASAAEENVEIESDEVLIEEDSGFDSANEVSVKSYNTDVPYWYFLEADKDQQKTLLKYIDDCYSSTKEKNEMKKAIKDIWKRYPGDLTEEDMAVLEQIDIATDEYLSDMYGTTGDISVKWTATPHREMTRIAVKKWGITDTYADIAAEAADDPDEWIHTPYSHYYDPDTGYGTADENCDDHATIAAAYYDASQLSAAYTELGYASHFLVDVGNPLHTGMVSEQVLHQWVHEDYEQYVYQNWDDGFEDIVSGNNYYISISDPEDAAQDLASYSNGYLSSLWMHIYYNPSTWESSSTVEDITENVLLKSAKYNMGLVKYMRS